ncbi:adenosylcobinamide-phosphate synthase CbiB [Thalassolituus sp. LLYu03]|uniref:adenosylcobinamide-phosphate synthase CbiB n=1 Tax=Thalassolituus sp. LLYu03 TaxID=3421656 RepID=UPI003D2B3B46
MLLLLCGFFGPALSPLLLLLWPCLLLAAMLLDRWLGEPSRFHPLVGFGRWAARVEAWLNRGRQRQLRGLLATLLVLAPGLLVAGLLWWLSHTALYLWLLAEVLVLYLCIGWQSLREHVGAVAQALSANDLDGARQKLSWIVSRDTQQLAPAEVAQAGIESLLENSSDALFASLFWFLLGGASLTLLHRWVNTLDAMWGYRTERFNAFGRFAARFDDVLAYWPARLTALGFALVSGHPRRALGCWRQQAGACASPNGGVVMTTGAGALGVLLSRRACYHGQWKTKPPMGCGPVADAADLPRAERLIRRTLWLSLLLAVLVALIAALMLALPVVVYPAGSSI